jgi:acyl-CoA dehydrogenase
MPEVLHDVARRAMQLHGSLGVSNEMPLADLYNAASWLALADGPSEVHKITLARQVLRDYQAGHELWPSEHLPTRREAAVAKLAEFLELEVAEQ